MTATARNWLTPIDYQQVDYIDAWGRTQSNGSYAQRLFDSFINPAYMTTDKGNCELADMLENAQAAGVADSITLDVYAYKNGGHKKAEVEEYIYSKVDSAAQRSALYYSLYKK